MLVVQLSVTVLVKFYLLMLALVIQVANKHVVNVSPVATSILVVSSKKNSSQ